MHKRQLVALGSALILAACSSLPWQGGATRSAAQQLEELMQRDWQRRLQESPFWLASMIGERCCDDRWADLSDAAIERGLAERRALLAELEAIDPQALDDSGRLNRELLMADLQQDLERARFKPQRFALNHLSGVHLIGAAVPRLRFAEESDYRNWIRRLQRFGAYVDQHIVQLRSGIDEGRVMPCVIAERVAAQLDAAAVSEPEDSEMFAPLAHLPANWPAPLRSELVSEGRAAMREVVLPALRRLESFFDSEYLPACRSSIAARDLPDGEAFYAFEARRYTTTTLTPEQIHQIGLAEVQRIRGEMLGIMRQTGFAGSFAEFLEFLRSDPRFFLADGGAIVREYRNIAQRIDPQLVRLFGVLPRMPYGVEPMPAAIAPDAPTAYYAPPAADGSRAGIFYANTYKPETRPVWEMEALTAHEAVPGHHLQIARQQELGELPMFRRFGGYTAFVEGWALYAESLGPELGLYRDPYARFGQLTYEMWRAIRLVVDTGMHQMGWSRERAIAFFRANAGKSEHDIAAEVDRYIAWPGQALAYKIGELRIRALRDQAERELGERFDLRAFHDLVLGAGALPLDVLERRVQAWIAERSAQG